jgi:hypothetical protein
MCATVSWGAHESFIHPIFVLKNGCDTIICDKNIFFLSRTSRHARALQSVTFVLIYLEMDFVAGLDMCYSNSYEYEL